jgi:hypothetical protein
MPVPRRVRPPSSPRRPRNPAEGAFFDAASEAGWAPWKRGWPDFFLSRGGEVALVEVKPRRSQGPSARQRAVLEALAAYGVPCYVWTPGGGFLRVRPRRGR